MPASSPRLTIDPAAPTSRAAFRHIAKTLGATNREADKLRVALLARWVGVGGSYELERQLQELESPEADGKHAVEALLTVWFASGSPVDGKLVAKDDEVLADVPEGLRSQLAEIAVTS